MSNCGTQSLSIVRRKDGLHKEVLRATHTHKVHHKEVQNLHPGDHIVFCIAQVHLAANRIRGCEVPQL